MDSYKINLRQLKSLKKSIQRMSRAQLIDKIWELSSDELETLSDVLILAKESEHELRKRLLNVVSWFEHLAM